MKRFFILTALMAVLGLTSCEKEASKAIVGTWEAISMEMQVAGVKMEVDMQEVGISMEFTFREDGTGTLSEMIEGEDLSMDFTYSVEGDMLMMNSEGEEEGVPVTIDGKNMTIVMDGDFLESPGAVTIHFVKK